MKSQIFVNLVEESLAEITYDSSLAGLNYSVGTETDGLQIVVSGYNDKLSVLLQVVLEKLNNEIVDQTSFDMIHERVSYNLLAFHWISLLMLRTLLSVDKSLCKC